MGSSNQDPQSEEQNLENISEKETIEISNEQIQVEEDDLQKNSDKETIIIKKLVRDKSIEILKSNGIECKYKNIKNTRFKYALFRKLVEESTECINATGTNFKVELADVLTVFFNIASILKINLKDLKGSQLKKPRSILSISKECLLQMGTPPTEGIIDIKEKLGEFWESFSFLLHSNGLTMVDIARIADKKDRERGSFSNNIFLVEISGPASNPIIQKYFKSYKKKEKNIQRREEGNLQNI